MPIAPWTTITEGQLLTRMAGKELAVFREAFSSPGEQDPVQVVIDLITERVRGAVGANSENILGAPGEVPSVLLDACLSLVVWRIMERSLGRIQDPTGARKMGYENAESLLAKVERGEGPTISEPTVNGTTIGPAGLVIVYAAQKDSNSRCDQDGF